MDSYAPQEMLRFLRALDAELEGPIRVTIIGGAAIGLVYDPTHATTDIDFVPVGDPDSWAAAERAARRLAHPVPVSSTAVFAAIEDVHRLHPLDLDCLVARHWESISQVIGPLEDFRLSFLALVERLFGAVKADLVEARIGREAPPLTCASHAPMCLACPR